MQLISATPSPYARKVRIALAEKDIPFELVTEVPWHSTTQTPKHNPLEKLPVLILDDGSSVYESSYILEYLELKYPQVPLLPLDVDGILAAKKLDVLCNGVCDAVVTLFFERMREPGKQSQEWQDRQYRKVVGGIREIDRLVGKHEFAVGKKFTLGDIAAATVCGYISVRFKEFEWRGKHPDLAAFCDRMEQRPSFKATVPVPQKISEKVV